MGVSIVTPAQTQLTPPSDHHGGCRHCQEDLRHLRLGWQGRARPLLPWRHHVRHGLQHHQEGLYRLGQTDEEGKKFAKFDDVVSKVEEALKTPDSQGTYADY